jgi:hypothetical protein
MATEPLSKIANEEVSTESSFWCSVIPADHGSPEVIPPDWSR